MAIEEEQHGGEAEPDADKEHLLLRRGELWVNHMEPKNHT